MCKIDIKALLEGRNYPEAGDILFGLMSDSLKKGEKVILNMEGVDSLPTMFLNTSIGQYIKDHGKDSLQGNLAFEKITAQQVVRVKEYLSRFA
ncbi:MAG: STAS-like domain-containing protein [Bacteroidales bacterium]|nr:STAS-like domain-containing protein [Bacteroidales bacterium]